MRSLIFGLLILLISLFFTHRTFPTPANVPPAMSPLDRIEDQLVTENHPPRYDIDGMDSDRCIALHNAILEHGWVTSGRTSDDFTTNTRTWWDVHGNTVEAGRLHPSLRLFLENARVVPHGYQPPTSFFYNVGGLHHPASFWYGPASSMFEDPNLILTLYNSHEPLAGTPDGLLYEQFSHTAIMHFDIEDDVVLEFEKWDKLESILTVWIEMIKRKKIVALPADVGKKEYEAVPGGGFRLVEGPQTDPATGAKRLYEELSPWTVQPWTARDLEDTLKTWQSAVDLIEHKMALDEATDPPTALYDIPTLDAAQIPPGFAREFLLKAKRPRFTHIAPGLRISLPQEFTTQPFITLYHSAGLSNTDETPPILLFRNDARIRSSNLNFFYPYSGPHALVPDCQTGLWLDRCDRASNTPFEDGCRLVLPFEFGFGHAKQSDITTVESPDGLLQLGANPYNERHPFQLQAFLEIVIMNLQQGYWTVNAHGVAGSIDIWRDADMEERWLNYFIPVGPGRWW